MGQCAHACPSGVAPSASAVRMLQRAELLAGAEQTRRGGGGRSGGHGDCCGHRLNPAACATPKPASRVPPATLGGRLGQLGTRAAGWTGAVQGGGTAARVPRRATRRERPPAPRRTSNSRSTHLQHSRANQLQVRRGRPGELEATASARAVSARGPDQAAFPRPAFLPAAQHLVRSRLQREGAPRPAVWLLAPLTGILEPRVGDVPAPLPRRCTVHGWLRRRHAPPRPLPAGRRERTGHTSRHHGADAHTSGARRGTRGAAAGSAGQPGQDHQ